MPDVEGFILAGGASSRMGTNKAQLRLGGQSFVERIAGALTSVAGRVRVVGARPDAGAEWGLESVADIYENCGALGGMHAAFTHCETRRAAIVSCDLPFVTRELFARLALLGKLGEGRRGEDAFEAVAPVQEDGRRQPLCAIYSRAACLAHAERLLRSGELRPRELLRQARTRWVNVDELADLRGASLFFLNVNTPDEYAHALAQYASNERT